jgi:hypothetical protein
VRILHLGIFNGGARAASQSSGRGRIQDRRVAAVKYLQMHKLFRNKVRHERRSSKKIDIIHISLPERPHCFYDAAFLLLSQKSL